MRRKVARQHDNWDVDVIVDNQRGEYPRENAIRNIQKRLDERTAAYGNNDDVLVTDDRDAAIKKLTAIRSAFERGELSAL